MTITNDNLPEHVESALKRVLQGSIDSIVQTVMEYHERTDCQAPDRGHRLAVIQTEQDGKCDTRYYLSLPNRGNNLPRVNLTRARNYFVEHVCNPSRCYRQAGL
jgi:hypothetical protein